jgi:hypothetical protein
VRHPCFGTVTIPTPLYRRGDGDDRFSRVYVLGTLGKSSPGPFPRCSSRAAIHSGHIRNKVRPERIAVGRAIGRAALRVLHRSGAGPVQHDRPEPSRGYSSSSHGFPGRTLRGMAIMQLVLFRDEVLHSTHVAYWFLMRIGMTLSFLMHDQANRWLIRRSMREWLP